MQNPCPLASLIENASSAQLYCTHVSILSGQKCVQGHSCQCKVKQLLHTCNKPAVSADEVVLTRVSWHRHKSRVTHAG